MAGRSLIGGGMQFQWHRNKNRYPKNPAPGAQNLWAENRLDVKTPRPQNSGPQNSGPQNPGP